MMAELSGEFENNNHKEQEFSANNIEKYVEGCEEVAVRLYDVTKNIIEDGKKPIILIPSRGAVPIFLLAIESLKNLENFLTDPNKVGLYPRRIFDFLSQGKIGTGRNPENSAADIILYPFTADVSAEKNGEEWLASKLRESCAKSFYDLTFKSEQYPEHLRWYYFLMNKLQKDLHGDQGLSPGEIVQILKDYKGADNGQIVLIDTVISGRASQDIVSAFASLGHKVAPILSVDSRSGGHFQPARKSAIERAVAWNYMGGQSPFIEFPLITEDKGAALLGLAAINFANFNIPGFFREVDTRFKNDFLPQSCLWTLPPDNLRQAYAETFYQFINLCSDRANGQPVPYDLSAFQDRLRGFISSHGTVESKEIKLITKVENGATAKESASHIVSIQLGDKQAKEWVREFASELFSKPS